MSSDAPAQIPDSAAGGGNSSRQQATTYWCHECDSSVTLLRSTPPLLCPKCRGEFLEEMELHQPLSPSPSPPPLTLTLTDSDDDLYFHPSSDRAFTGPVYYELFDRLLGRMARAVSNEDHLLTAPSGFGGPYPASKSSVEAIPTVKISASFLAADPLLLCAVCKDEFALDSDARRLPCGHIYHSDCILRWLSQHNSCPVCRFQLPTADPDRRLPGNLLEEDRAVVEEEEEEDVLELGSTLRRIARRHRLVFPERRLGLGLGPASSGDGGSSVGPGGGGGEARVDDERDVLMPDVTRVFFD